MKREKNKSTIHNKSLYAVTTNQGNRLTTEGQTDRCTIYVVQLERERGKIGDKENPKLHIAPSMRMNKLKKQEEDNTQLAREI